ncbi:MAG: motility associated factor glycosyltransferase family protein [Parachlamydiaceae bacterium]
MTKNFDENCALFAEQWPLEAFKIQSEDLGEIDPKKYDEGVSAWAKELPLEGVDTAILYGIGFGAAFDALHAWLERDSNRHLLFLEDDLAVLRAFFETDKAGKLLSHPQVTICYLQDVEGSAEALDFIYWVFSRTKFRFFTTPYYQKTKRETADKLSEKIAYDAELKSGLVEEYEQYGVSFFRNFYSNIKELPGALWGNKLFKQFEGIPAIILGAGPSLSKQLSLLKELADKALIFAGGCALNALQAHGLKPHFGAGIDPNDVQLLRLKETSEFPVPFFYRNRLFATAIREIKGPRLYVSGAGGYDISEWYEEKFGLTGDFLDEGHNVVNFCTELALRMGCNPIVFVGLDLAFTDSRHYAEGVKDTITCKEAPIVRKDIYGHDVTTQWKWIFEADWLSQLVKEHTETAFYNATEGGIGIPEVKNLPLKDVVNEKLLKKHPIESMVNEALRAAKIPQVTAEKIQAATHELKESLERTISYIDQLVLEIDKEAAKDEPQEKLRSGKAILIETDLFDEPAYRYILDIFHHVYARISYRDSLKLKQNKGSKRTPKELAIAHLQIQKKKLQFLKEVAQANLLLIQFAETL